MLDSLMAIFITVCMCGLCFSVYRATLLYEHGYENYRDRVNNEIEDILNSIMTCEGCILDEPD